MAYPKPVRDLNPAEAVAFLKELGAFKLTPAQAALYKESKSKRAKDIYLED